MNDAPHDASDEVPDVELAALVRDWIALVETELAAWMTDRETQEAWTALVALWWQGFEATMRKAAAASVPDDATRGSAPGPASGGAAPAAGDDERLELARRLAALEARLAELEAKPRRAKPAAKAKPEPEPKAEPAAKPKSAKPKSVGKPKSEPKSGGKSGAKSKPAGAGGKPGADQGGAAKRRR